MELVRSCDIDRFLSVGYGNVDLILRPNMKTCFVAPPSSTLKFFSISSGLMPDKSGWTWLLLTSNISRTSPRLVVPWRILKVVAKNFFPGMVFKATFMTTLIFKSYS